MVAAAGQMFKRKMSEWPGMNKIYDFLEELGIADGNIDKIATALESVKYLMEASDLESLHQQLEASELREFSVLKSHVRQFVIEITARETLPSIPASGSEKCAEIAQGEVDECKEDDKSDNEDDDIFSSLVMLSEMKKVLETRLVELRVVAEEKDVQIARLERERDKLYKAKTTFRAVALSTDLPAWVTSTIAMATAEDSEKLLSECMAVWTTNSSSLVRDNIGISAGGSVSEEHICYELIKSGFSGLTKPLGIFHVAIIDGLLEKAGIRNRRDVWRILEPVKHLITDMSWVFMYHKLKGAEINSHLDARICFTGLVATMAEEQMEYSAPGGSDSSTAKEGVKSAKVSGEKAALTEMEIGAGQISLLMRRVAELKQPISEDEKELGTMLKLRGIKHGVEHGFGYQIPIGDLLALVDQTVDQANDMLASMPEQGQEPVQNGPGDEVPEGPPALHFSQESASVQAASESSSQQRRSTSEADCFCSDEPEQNRRKECSPGGM